MSNSTSELHLALISLQYSLSMTGRPSTLPHYSLPAHPSPPTAQSQYSASRVAQQWGLLVKSTRWWHLSTNVTYIAEAMEMYNA
ncbi:uncharacterized protein K441DRAFT_653074 [Cenococcum geophilum 1.58]|uniref:uncharacterized protein n=1 Tax=Cenococcum geophilum 1.58 TaxID=794803 RepID=UPI00358FEA9B|nr:hypothetical protein K441DRAFT_653074 [Cenococcum geophilum 1.58]